MKKTLIAVITFFAVASVFGEKEPVYISPNNDGAQDVLEVPVKIKEKRYVSEWNFIITDEKGNVVRSIGNKEKRPEKIGFKKFFQQLVTPKAGVVIPEFVTWNGIMDNGEVAPDGKYFYSLSATDDNGNSSSTVPLTVIVDSTAPEIEIVQPSNDAKIFGEGAKSVLRIRQSGSKEDLWTGVFSDVSGNPVKTLKWVESEPLTFDWNGTDDNGTPVKDGIYSYRIFSQDRAGNKSNPAAVSNIIYSAEKPATNITLTGSRYFSPNGNGKNDEVTFELKIPTPDQAKTGNKLVEWKVLIENKDGKTVRTYGGSDNPPSVLKFDGKDESGKTAAEGLYYAKVTAKYLNGFETAPLNSPLFMLDLTPPSASVRAAGSTFSPDGDGNLDVLEMIQTTGVDSGSPVENWTGTITNKNGNIVKTLEFASFLPEKVLWDGLDSKNQLAEDGEYVYTLTASDLAGNVSAIAPVSFVLDTSKTELILTVSPQAFNPAVKNIRFVPVVKTGSQINSYVLKIKDSAENVVKTFAQDKALPQFINWNGLADDGSRCKDGSYYASLSTVSANGSEAGTNSQSFIIDTSVPSISVASPYSLFSPDSDGNRDVLPVEVKECSSEEKWACSIISEKGDAVKTYAWKGTVPSFEWDGTDDSGNKVADGSYRIVFTSEDAAQNSTKAELSGIKVDNRETKAYVTAELDAFAPNGDGFADVQKFSIRLSLKDGIKDWSFAITSAEGNTVRKWSSADSANVPSEINWDGKDEQGNTAEGVFTGNLLINYEKGNVVSQVSSAFICTVTPPSLTVKTAPKYFSPDNDGEDDDLYILLRGESAVPLKSWSFCINDPENGRKFWSVGGKSTITEKLVWDGRGNNGELVQSAMDYPYVFTVTDALGMTSVAEGKISVDVLVIRAGDVLKMAVPSIIFRSDSADFKTELEIKGGITDAQKANNERVLKRIAEILNKFKNYTVTIEGHANNISGTDTEENEDTVMYGKALKPLSQERAEFVRQELIRNGVASERLTAVGRGGSMPVVQRSDKDNWWKNRRVEFILNK